VVGDPARARAIGVVGTLAGQVDLDLFDLDANGSAMTVVQTCP
jgi:hypothetical protein